MQDYFSNLLRVFCLVEKKERKMEGNGLNKEEKRHQIGVRIIRHFAVFLFFRRRCSHLHECLEK